MMPARGRSDERSRRTNALTVPTPVTCPAHSARVSSSVSFSVIRSTRCSKVDTTAAPIFTAPSAAVGLGVEPQPRRDLVDDDRVLLPVVLDVGEHERQQLQLAELVDGPPERLDAAGAPGDIGTAGSVVRDRRGPEARRRERLGGQAQITVGGPQVVVEPGVGLVEEQQVLALDAEDQRLGVDGPGAERAGAEDRVQQEQGEAGLGGHTGDAADRHVRAPGPVKELHVEVDRRAVPAAPHRHPVGHLVEVQRLRSLVAGGPADHLARARRHVAPPAPPAWWRPRLSPGSARAARPRR